MTVAYRAAPMRVRFGSGATRELADELDELGLDRVLVLSTPEQEGFARAVAAPLGGRVAGVFGRAAMHVPVEVADAATAEAARLGADGCLAVGGGSTVGLGKAVALRSGVPVVAVPTTYAGSEMTPVWGLTEGGVKLTGRDPAVLPRSVVYDPDLTVGLPVALSVTSGLNAVAHAVEGLWAPDRSPLPDLMAGEGARAMLGALPRIVADPADATGRADALRGAWLCGAVLGATTMSLHHKLCHVLGGTFGLPHSPVHAVLLPHVLAFNGPVAPDAVAAVAAGLGISGRDPADVARALWARAGELGSPTALGELGFTSAGEDEAVRQVSGMPYANPRTVTQDAVAAMLGRARRGAAPEV